MKPPSLVLALFLSLSAPPIAVLSPPAARGDEAAAQPAPAPAPAPDVDVDAVVAGLKSDDDAARLAAAEQAAEVADDAVTRPLARLLTDDRFEIRAASIRALGARSSDHAKKDAAKALAARMSALSKSVHDEGELALTVQALHDLAQPSTIRPLLDGIDDSASEDLYRARVMAVANVPHADAVDELIQHLARRGRGKWGGNKRSVVEALQYATGERHGADPDTWRAWWKEAKKTFDFGAAARRRADEAERQREREQKRRDREGRRKQNDG